MKNHEYIQIVIVYVSMSIGTLSYIVIQIIDYDANNVNTNKKKSIKYILFFFSLCWELYMFVSFVHIIRM